MIVLKKKFDLVGHPECSHNWIHNAMEQCKWDNYGNSENVCYFYKCTMCEGEYWSSIKDQDIPHYKVRGVKNGRI